MSLQFMLGKASEDKRQSFVDDIDQLLKNETDATVFYIVPDHVKFQMEMDILNRLQDKKEDADSFAMMQVQVFSFTRLAWYFLQDTATFTQPQLTRAGLAMLVRKLLVTYEQELSIYRGEVKKAGFVEQLTDLLIELRAGTLTKEDIPYLISQLGDTPKEQDFKLKMQDIQCIYHAFETALFGKYIEQEDVLKALIHRLETLDLSQTSIYVEGFYRFNAQERDVLMALIKGSKKLTIALNLDKGYPTEKPALHELFQAPGEVYYQLYQGARNLGVPVLKDRFCKTKEPTKSEIQVLEDFWIESSDVLNMNQLQQYQLPENQQGIQIWSAQNKRAEVNHVAREIRKLVASGHYRFKDILVLTRDLGEYENLFKPVFSEHEIAFFDDAKEKMSSHPLVECLQSIIAIAKKNWRYPDIMRLLRTELFVPQQSEIAELTDRALKVTKMTKLMNQFRAKIDVTENVILAYGYEGFYWTQDKPWMYTKFSHMDTDMQSDEDKAIEAEANEIKNFMVAALVPLFKKWEQAKTTNEALQHLYLFLETSGIKNQLAFWRDQAIEKNDLEVAKQHEQVWQSFVQLLDEYVEILGEESFSLDEFRDILTAGFEEMTYGMVPPSIDQVILSNMEVARIGQAKVTFILGLTEGSLPAKVENKSMLTNEDRAYFSQVFQEEKYLKPSVEQRVATEPYMAYLAFTSSSDKLILSYPASDDTKDAPMISSYLTRIQKGLGLPLIEKLETSIEQPGQDMLSFISSKRSTLTQLILAFRGQLDQEEAMNEEWFSIYNQLLADKEMKPILSTLIQGMSHQNIAVSLTSDVVTELYGASLYTSVSRMENFYACHFKHFANDGLKLAERQVFDLSPASTGELFHDALDKLFKQIQLQGLDWQHMSPKQLAQLTNEVLVMLYGEKKFAILNHSNRMKYIKYQLSQTIQRMAWVLSEQGKISGMNPVATEVLFGQIAGEKGVPGLTIALNNESQLHVRGKIDRVDQMMVDGKNYLSVVDYKSSAHKFDYRDAYYGLAMQMLTYLDTAVMNAEKIIGTTAQGAGAFYLHIKNPLLNGKELKEDASQSEQLLKEFKLDGILLQDEAMVRQLDTHLEPKSSSMVYPVAETLKAGLKSTQFVEENELDALLQHNRQLFQDAGNKILDGDTAINPFYKDKTSRACSHCPFRSVCQFDVMLKENQYHRLEKLKRDDVLAKITNEGGKKNDELTD